MSTLDQLPAGHLATITHIQAVGPVGQRLCELGVLDGAAVRMVRVAPLGDPLEIEIGGCFLSLRKAEARQIEIQAAS